MIKTATQSLTHKILELLDNIELTDTIINDLHILDNVVYETIIMIAKGEIIEANQYQRGNAIYVLGRLKNKQAEDILIDILMQSNDERLRILSIQALGKLATQKSAQALANVLYKESSSLVEIAFAIQILGNIGENNELQRLEQFQVKNNSPLFQYKAHAAIVSIKERIKN